jgi:hypothetical protein
MADHSPPKARQHCVWCATDYAAEASRARQTAMFCSRRCELEARYWLFSVLSACPEPE